MKFLKKISFVCHAVDNIATYPAAIWNGETAGRDSADGISKAPDKKDWQRVVHEVAAAQRSILGYDPDTTIDSYGTVATVTGLTVKEYGNAACHKTILTLDEVEVATLDGTTPATHAAWGTKNLYTFPEGHVVILAAHQIYPVGGLEARDGGGAGIKDTAELEIGVGSVARADANDFDLHTVTTNDNIVPLVVAAALVSGASNAIEASPATARTNIDGSAAAVVARLNVITATNDADHGPLPDVLKVSGTITIVWTMQGND